LAKAGRSAFERMAEAGLGDAGALAAGLRQRITSVGLRALAASAVHVAAAAPERLAAVYDDAAAGWLDGEVSPPRLRALDPLPISPGWWSTIWSIATPPIGAGRLRYAQQMMELAGELDLQINPRMAAAALEFPGVADAAGRGSPQSHDVERLAQFSPASLGYALSQELLASGSPAFDPYWSSVLPYLRHMPPPLGYINVEVIQSMPLWALVAGYTSRGLDRVAFGGFLMGQVGHHYSPLASAVTLTTAAVKRPDNIEVLLDCLFKGWAHGRATQPLMLVSWEPLWAMRVDQVRETLRIRPFDSPYARSARQGWVPRVV
jgi:ubiquinone biosynthesis protein Coq4